MLDHLAFEGPGILGGLEATASRDVHAIDQLAVDVELELAHRGVAKTPRPRALVPGQPVERDLVNPPLTACAIESL